MAIHPDTIDGYFVSGDPLTGNVPAGAKPSLDFFNALLDLLDSTPAAPITTVTDETTLTEANGTLFVNTAEGVTVPVHLPVYATVTALKGFRVKNIGQGIITLDAADALLIDGQASIDLAPGDRCQLAKDGTNWQTI